MIPPLEGGIDSQQSLQLFVSPVTNEYRNRSESLSEYVHSHAQRASRHNVPTNPDKIGMVARKGKTCFAGVSYMIICVVCSQLQATLDLPFHREVRYLCKKKKTYMLFLTKHPLKGPVSYGIRCLLW